MFLADVWPFAELAGICVAAAIVVFSAYRAMGIVWHGGCGIFLSLARNVFCSLHLLKLLFAVCADIDVVHDMYDAV